MNFPSFVSLTITNTCNLRCQMCGQWSERGYLHAPDPRRRREERRRMGLADWKRVVDEVAGHGCDQVLIRGGEPFLFPGIIELLDHLKDRGIHPSIDTNGTMLDRFAEDLVRIGDLHLTISIDGPEAGHDKVRAVPGTFRKIKSGLASLAAAERAAGREVGKSLCFTISRYSYQGLGELPDAARELGVRTVSIVPYYYLPNALGERYQREMAALGCTAFSWRGFQHEESGVDFAVFREQYRRFTQTLGDLEVFPYLPLTEDEYRTWFEDPEAPVGLLGCHSPDRLLDVQPSGDANFCVDFPDYSLGNVLDAPIAELWTSERAERFRAARRAGPFAACLRCGAKYMAELSSAAPGE